MEDENKENEDNGFGNKRYEITFLVISEAPSLVSEILKKHNFTVLNEKPFVKIRSAYPIKKSRESYLGDIFFEGDPQFLNFISRDLKLNQNVIRFFVTKIAAKSRTVESRPSFRPSIRIIKGIPRKEEEKSSRPILTNEALEKKIEEILK